MTAAKSDRLLAALLDRLPGTSAPWRRDDRIAWLRLITLAFDVVYGPAGGIAIAADAPGRPDAAAAAAPAAAGPAKPPRFHVDADGFAMADGRPIAIDELPPGATLWDERQGVDCGDPAAILWRDVGAARTTLPPGVVLTPVAPI